MLKKICSRKITPLKIAVCMRQLSCLVAAGIPITRCFDIMEQTQESLIVRNLFYSIKISLQSGHSLFDSVNRRPVLFTPFACQLIKLGEQTGKLEPALSALADHYEARLRLQQKIQHALFYPCILLAAAIIMVISMLAFVIPRFAELFSNVDKPLPLLTQLIFRLASFVNQYLWMLLIMAGGLTACIIFTGNLHRLLAWLKHNISHLPLIRSCITSIGLTRFTRNLALALSAGMPILESINLAAEASNHHQVTTNARKLRASISTGLYLHQAMQALPLFPALLQQMVKAGEESGSLETMLNKAADLLESSTESRINRLTQLLEPLIMAVLGVLIGGLVIGMYLPVFNLGSTF